MLVEIPIGTRHMASLRGDADGLEGLPSGSIASDSSTSSWASHIKTWGEKGDLSTCRTLSRFSGGTKGSYNQHKSEWLMDVTTEKVAYSQQFLPTTMRTHPTWHGPYTSEYTGQVTVGIRPSSDAVSTGTNSGEMASHAHAPIRIPVVNPSNQKSWSEIPKFIEKRFDSASLLGCISPGSHCIP